MTNLQPSLFGLTNSNRNFSRPDSWGKNQFNSSFPAALCCYMHYKGLDANYIHMHHGKYSIGTIPIKTLFGLDPLDKNTYYAFESAHNGFQQFVEGTIPRTDLVVQDLSSTESRASAFLEVKLTALPDNTTFNLSEEKYGSELVVRPDTIVYQATSIAKSNPQLLRKLASPNILSIADWTDANSVIPFLMEMKILLTSIVADPNSKQTPLLLQPVWKTNGKSPELADNCLDVFAWSDLAFAWFILQIANTDNDQTVITRQTRTLIWLFRMLLDIGLYGKVAHHKIIDELTYNTKNDKAFASSGNITNQYMSCQNLSKPRVTKFEIKNIILGNGQDLLSPERRFDAIIFNSPNLFT